MTSETKKKLFICIGLALATIIVYGQAATFDFLAFDDNYFVTENYVVQQGVSLKNLRWSFTAFVAGAWQPVTWLSHMLDIELFGLNGGGHHLVNVLFHIANTLVLFLLLARLTKYIWRSALVAALFALHPLHVESVAWIAERRDVLSIFWWLLTMWSYAVWAEKKGVIRYFLVLFCFGMGIMSKSMLVSLPFILLLFDIWPLERLKIERFADLWEHRKTIAGFVLEKVPMLGLAFLAGIFTIIAQERHGSIGSLAEYPFMLRIENGLVSYVRYLFMTLWPVNLIPYYPYPAGMPIWQTGGSLLLLVLITAYCLKKIKLYPYLAFGWFWFLVTLLPVIGIIKHGSDFALADRYTYVTLVGIFIMAVWGAADFIENRGWTPKMSGVCAGVILLVLSALCFMQVSHWRDTRSLFTYTLTVDPDNRVALNQVGVDARKRGDFEEALKYLPRAASLYPDDFLAQVHAGKLYLEMGRFEEAKVHYLKAQELIPDDARIYVDLGLIAIETGDLGGAENHFRKALEVEPQNTSFRLNLATLLLQQKKLKAAEQQFLFVIRTAPNIAYSYNGLGAVYLEQGRFLDAVNSFREALRLDPDLGIARENLEIAREKLDGEKDTR